MKQRAELGKYYWCIVTLQDSLLIRRDKDDRSPYDNDRYTLGNYFIDIEEALAAKVKIEKVLKGEL